MNRRGFLQWFAGAVAGGIVTPFALDTLARGDAGRAALSRYEVSKTIHAKNPPDTPYIRLLREVGPHGWDQCYIWSEDHLEPLP